MDKYERIELSIEEYTNQFITLHPKHKKELEEQKKYALQVLQEEIPTGKEDILCDFLIAHYDNTLQKLKNQNEKSTNPKIHIMKLIRQLPKKDKLDFIGFMEDDTYMKQLEDDLKIEDYIDIPPKGLFFITVLTTVGQILELDREGVNSKNYEAIRSKISVQHIHGKRDRDLPPNRHELYYLLDIKLDNMAIPFSPVYHFIREHFEGNKNIDNYTRPKVVIQWQEVLEKSRLNSLLNINIDIMLKNINIPFSPVDKFIREHSKEDNNQEVLKK